MKNFLLLFLSVMFMFSCGKEPLSYLHKTPEELHVSQLYPLTSVKRESVNIILVFDISGSMYDEIQLVLNSVEEALDTLTNASYKIPWQLGVLGANVDTATTSTSDTEYDIEGSTTYLKKKVVAINFRGFPEDAILEQQDLNKNTKLDPEIKNQIRKEQTPISYQSPHYGTEIEKVLNNVLEWVRGTTDRQSRKFLFGNSTRDEMMFAPVAVALQHNPSFIRSPDDYLAIFYFTDAKEQSDLVHFGGGAWNGMTSEKYLEELLVHVDGNQDKIFMGGGFTAPDLKITELGCISEGGFKIKGSKYEDLIMKTAKTQKAIISSCVSSEVFRQLFTQLFNQLIYKITIPEFSIADSEVPICASTLKVFYKGKPLSRESGIWQFDWEFNILRFNTLEFIDNDDENAHIHIEFDMDNGFDNSC